MGEVEVSGAWEPRVAAEPGLGVLQGSFSEQGLSAWGRRGELWEVGRAEQGSSEEQSKSEVCGEGKSKAICQPGRAEGRG